MARFSLYAMSITDLEEQFQNINSNSRKISEYFIYLNLGGYLFAILASFYLKKDLQNFTKELNSDIQKPSDFTLKINNIDKNSKPQALKYLLETNLDVKVENITYCYNTNKIMSYNQELI